jgi:predicted RNA-binding Zn-ribbon protein involved in translation (DUF1610 family)
MRKHYLNVNTGEDTASAAQAMTWHRAGNMVQVNTYYNEPHKTGLANVVHVPGATQETECREDENRAHCKHIARELDAYVNGDLRRCPDCGEEIRRDWDEVGTAFKCPHCGEINDPDNWEQLSVWDFLGESYDIEYRCDSRRELRSVCVMVACGGPNIYIDTASKDVELYWWSERARYPLSYEAVEAVDEWAAELWEATA